MIIETDKDIKEILENVRTIAVVGATRREEAAGNSVPAYLLSKGYRIIPVSPKYEEVLGQKCYPSLRDISEPVDMVECFISSDKILPIAKDAIAINAKVLWMQLGIINEEAAKIASDAGTKVVMNRCPHIEIPRLFPGESD